MDSWTWENFWWELIWCAIGVVIPLGIALQQIVTTQQQLHKAEREIVKLLKLLGHSDARIPEDTK